MSKQERLQELQRQGYALPEARERLAKEEAIDKIRQASSTKGLAKEVADALKLLL